MEPPPARTRAVSNSLFTKVVAKLLPFHCTADPEVKLLPTTLSTNPALCCALLFGDKASILRPSPCCTAGPAINVLPLHATAARNKRLATAATKGDFLISIFSTPLVVRVELSFV